LFHVHRSIHCLVALTLSAALGAIAITACSSSGGGGGSSSGDGGSSSGDPGAEGGGPDGSSSGNDASSSSSGGDGSAGCAETAKTICDNFDNGTAIDAKWVQEANGGSATVVPEGQSAPNALAIAINAGSGGAVFIEKEFPFTTKVHCELDMKLTAVPTDGDLDLFSITTKTAVGDYYVYFAHSATGYVFAEFADPLPGGGNVDKKQPIAAPPTGSWFHVVIDNDGANATLTANGATSTLTGIAQPNGTSRNVQVGAPFSAGTNTNSRALYDNVVCTF
jgi:hypothetical protein